MKLNEISGAILGAAIELHKDLGPGLLESAYEECLAINFEERGLRYQRQLPQSILYKGREIKPAYRLDFLVEGLVVVELKAVNEMTDTIEAQLLTYLRFSEKPLGLAINFKVPRLMEGVRRVVHGDISRYE